MNSIVFIYYSQLGSKINNQFNEYIILADILHGLNTCIKKMFQLASLFRLSPAVWVDALISDCVALSAVAISTGHVVVRPMDPRERSV